MTTTKPEKIVCATCQSWHGIRRYNARFGLIELDPSSMKVSFECSMRYKKPGLTPATGCRGYVKWCELP